MKKQAYMKPAMQVVELRQSHQLLGGSPSSQTSIQMRGDQINEEEDIW